mgnify:CR=1 FL=1
MGYHLKAAARTSSTDSEHPPYRAKPHVALRQVSITGQRYYSPELGRFISRDPAKDESFGHVLKAWLSGGSSAGGQRALAQALASAYGNSEHLYSFVRNAPLDNIEFLGLFSCRSRWCRFGDKAGSECCPACEIDELRESLRVSKNILAALRRGDIPRTDPDTGKDYRTVAGGRCKMQGSNDQPGKWAFKKTPKNAKSCVGWCVYVHEAMHAHQCESRPRKSLPWDLYPYSGDAMAKIEIPAYTMGIKCLQVQIKQAERDISRYGSQEEACRCCSKRH